MIGKSVMSIRAETNLENDNVKSANSHYDILLAGGANLAMI
jgi:hypothetical protein